MKNILYLHLFKNWIITNNSATLTSDHSDFAIFSHTASCAQCHYTNNLVFQMLMTMATVVVEILTGNDDPKWNQTDLTWLTVTDWIQYMLARHSISFAYSCRRVIYDMPIDGPCSVLWIISKTRVQRKRKNKEKRKRETKRK